MSLFLSHRCSDEAQKVQQLAPKLFFQQNKIFDKNIPLVCVCACVCNTDPNNSDSSTYDNL